MQKIEGKLDCNVALEKGKKESEFRCYHQITQLLAFCNEKQDEMRCYSLLRTFFRTFVNNNNESCFMFNTQHLHDTKYKRNRRKICSH